MRKLTRRQWIQAGGLGAAALAAPGRASAQDEQPERKTWSLGINTSTIRPASLEDKVKATAEAGFDAIELWDGDLRKYEGSGKSLADLAKRIQDLGLTVANIIGIWNAMF